MTYKTKTTSFFQRWDSSETLSKVFSIPYLLIIFFIASLYENSGMYKRNFRHFHKGGTLIHNLIK